VTTFVRGRRIAALTLTAGLVVLGCGDDDGGEDAREDSTTTTEGPSTTTTQPPATDLDAVRPIVEELLARSDEVTAEILMDPAVANDPNAPILEELAEIYTEQTYQDLVGVYRRNAETGMVFEPYNSDQMRVTSLAGELTAVDHNKIEGLVCSVYHYRSDSPAAGGTLLDGVAQPGTLRVVRVDGIWQIDLLGNDETQQCEPGGADA
jgi:hypothetical protein